MTWLQRELIPGFSSFESLLKRPLVFDLDDAIWINFASGEKGFERVCRCADLVISGNSYIAKKVSSYGVEAVIIPTPVDTNHYFPAGAGDDGGENVIVGWIGTSGNFSQLDHVRETLIQVIKSHLNARFLLVSDRDYLPFRGLGSQYEFVRWSAENEVSQLQRMDIGIMPLRNEPWSLGKCSYKMLQNMASGAAVVGSRVGMNKEVVEHGASGYLADTPQEWADALHDLIIDKDTRRELASAGRLTVVERYSVAANLPKLAASFRGVCERR
jgi:glycosyltransferase involved in cell wall biosynthesis